MTVVVVSGYFNPIHPGHISMIVDAKEYADKLIVIVNSDKQVKEIMVKLGIEVPVVYGKETTKAEFLQKIDHP